MSETQKFTIGIVLETESDADLLGIDKSLLYHWRVPKEIEAIVSSIEELGYMVEIIGTPETLLFNIDKYKQEIDFIFNLSVGFISRFRLGKGPSLYELAGIPYSGADPYTKITTQNKQICKAFFDKMLIPTPSWTLVSQGDSIETALLPDFPLIVKPAYEGSSIGINKSSLVNNSADLKEAVRIVHEELNMPVVIEAFISGYEYKVGIIGNGQNKSVYMLEDVKTDGSSMEDDFLYYRVKTDGIYNKVKRDIYEQKYSGLLNMCLKAYALFEPVDYGTFDIRGDHEGNCYIIEFNADATLHPDRTLAKCCELHGISYSKMIEEILKTALNRWGLL